MSPARALTLGSLLCLFYVGSHSCRSKDASLLGHLHGQSNDIEAFEMRSGRGFARVILRSLNAGESFPRTTVNKRHSRAFRASKRLAIIRPFLLSDIGEGGAADVFLILISDLLIVNRYQGGTDHSMVRGTRSSCRAIRQDLRGPIG